MAITDCLDGFATRPNLFSLTLNTDNWLEKILRTDFYR